jgi:phage baseplate assembly protein W
MPDDPRAFLGKGWRFPVSVNLTGGVSSSQYEENIRQSIFVILGTAPGERVMRPDFGCRIHDLLFAPNNTVTAVRAAYYCEEALYKYEPRIHKVDVEATPNDVEPNRLDLHITYVIEGSNNTRNLVYPFYLRNADEQAAEAAAIAEHKQKTGA